MKTAIPFLALSLTAAWAVAAGAQDDPFGGAGGQFLVAQELPGSVLEAPGRCATHFAPLGAAPEAIREARLVAPVVDPTRGTLDFEAAASASPIGEVSVCFLASEGRDHGVVLVLELEKAGQSLLVEAAGTCREYPVPLETKTLFQSCSLHITGPKAAGIRSGTITSGGLVPKAQPSASVAPNTWTIFVVRD